MVNWVVAGSVSAVTLVSAIVAGMRGWWRWMDVTMS